jgi:hypothetical protein
MAQGWDMDIRARSGREQEGTAGAAGRIMATRKKQ